MLFTVPNTEKQIRFIDVIDIMGVIVVPLYTNGLLVGASCTHIQHNG